MQLLAVIVGMMLLFSPFLYYVSLKNRSAELERHIVFLTKELLKSNQEIARLKKEKEDAA